MFKKKIATGDFKNSDSKNTFPKGTTFIMDERFWKVTEQFVDDNANWRRVVADDGTEELVILPTLEKDLKTGSLVFSDKSNLKDGSNTTNSLFSEEE